MLAQQDSPFRKVVVVACSQPGRLIEVDIAPDTHPSRAVMWNCWRPEQHPQPQPSRKRRRRAPLTLRSRPRDTSAPIEPWMTGITVGPRAWEPIRAAAEAAAAGAEAAATAAAAGAGDPDSAEAAAAVDGGGSLSRAQRRRPMGPTLYACCYSVPGVVAHDGTTLLPLGVLIRFEAAEQAAPEGICASSDSLFVLNCLNCTITRIALRPTLRAADGGSGSGGGGGAAAAVAAAAKLQHARYGGGLPYGYGVVLATIDAADGWIGWGIALSPDGRALYCAVDLPYKGRSYTQTPPPRTSGSVLCVPLECLRPRGGGGAGVGAGGEGAAAVAGQLPGAAADQQHHLQQQEQQEPPQELYFASDTGISGSGSGAAAAAAAAPFHYLRGGSGGVLRRPSGLCFSPDGSSLWVTSYDTGIVELAGPARGELAGTVLQTIPLPLPLPPPPPPLPLMPPVAALDGPPLQPPTGAGPETPSGRRSTPSRALRPRPQGSGTTPSAERSSSSGRRAGVGAAEPPPPPLSPHSDPRVMLPWDVCWVPQGPPAPSNRIPSGSAGVDAGSRGLAAAAAFSARAPPPPPPPPPLLCVTLHEDSSQRERAPSGAECRLGVLEAAAGLGADSEGLAGPRASSSADQGAVPVSVRVRVRWRATREHSHPSMACVV